MGETRHVVHVERDQFGDPGAGAVQQLQQRLVPQAARGSRVGSGQQRLHLIDRQRLRQPASGLRRRHPGRWVVGGQPVLDGEPVQRLHRAQCPGHAARRQCGTVGVTSCSAPENAVTSASVTAVSSASRHFVQKLRVAGQIAPVAGDGVREAPRSTVRWSRNEPTTRGTRRLPGHRLRPAPRSPQRCRGPGLAGRPRAVRRGAAISSRPPSRAASRASAPATTVGLCTRPA